MWIDAVCGLLHVSRVYSQADRHNTDEESVPLPLGLATYFALADSFGGSKEWGKGCETRHTEVVVEDKRWLASCNSLLGYMTPVQSAQSASTWRV